MLGTVLGDGQLHEEFYAADGAVRETMMDLFSLNPIGSGNETTEGEST
ncbi:MAG: hypothetical protein IKN04_02850 [Clostridia bacterium]|nr:hypothetical protein [Clostridia bacterium]